MPRLASTPNSAANLNRTELAQLREELNARDFVDYEPVGRFVPVRGYFGVCPASALPPSGWYRGAG